MTELEKIEYAKSFIDKLANGINPIDNSPIPDGDIANNVRLSRCFFYVSDILRRVIENGGTSPKKAERIRKKEFSLTEEEYAKIRVSQTPVPVSKIAEHLNSLVDSETTKSIAATTINDWLVEAGFLEIVTLSDGKNRKLPTSQGNDMGLFTEERIGQYGPYLTVLFSTSAQQFVYDNVDSIITLKREKSKKSVG